MASHRGQQERLAAGSSDCVANAREQIDKASETSAAAGYRDPVARLDLSVDFRPGQANPHFLANIADFIGLQFLGYSSERRNRHAIAVIELAICSALSSMHAFNDTRQLKFRDILP